VESTQVEVIVRETLDAGGTKAHVLLSRKKLGIYGRIAVREEATHSCTV